MRWSLVSSNRRRARAIARDVIPRWHMPLRDSGSENEQHSTLRQTNRVRCSTQAAELGLGRCKGGVDHGSGGNVMHSALEEQRDEKNQGGETVKHNEQAIATNYIIDAMLAAARWCRSDRLSL